MVALSLTRKTPPSRSAMSRSVESCLDMAPKYQLKRGATNGHVSDGGRSIIASFIHGKPVSSHPRGDGRTAYLLQTSLVSSSFSRNFTRKDQIRPINLRTVQAERSTREAQGWVNYFLTSCLLPKKTAGAISEATHSQNLAPNVSSGQETVGVSSNSARAPQQSAAG